MAKTNAERQKDRRLRLKAEGIKRVEVLVTPRLAERFGGNNINGLDIVRLLARLST
jgi:hypothetical protein